MLTKIVNVALSLKYSVFGAVGMKQHAAKLIKLMSARN